MTFPRDSVFAAVLLLSGSALSGGALAATAAPAAPADPAAALITQSHAAAAKGDTDLAVRLAQSAIVADPARPATYDALGDIYAGNNQPEYARNFYNKALAIDPTDQGATKAIAALDRAGDTRKADAADGAKPQTP